MSQFRYCKSHDEICKLQYHELKEHVRKHRNNVADCVLRGTNRMRTYYMDTIIPSQMETQETKTPDPSLVHNERLVTGPPMSRIMNFRRENGESISDVYQRTRTESIATNVEDREEEEEEVLVNNNNDFITTEEFFECLHLIEEDRKRVQRDVIQKMIDALEQFKLL